MPQDATWDPASLLRQWSAAMRAVPNTLVQPILQGWTLNVNAFNSSAPQTEAEVVQRHSYGRQLGRISEVVALLLDASKLDKTDKRVTDFRAMQQDIADIKAGNPIARVEQLISDLKQLELLDPAAHRRLVAELKKNLK